MRRPVDLEALIVEGRRSAYQPAPVVLSPSISASLIGTAPRAEVKAQADETADLYLYGTIGGWFGKSAEQVIDELRALPASTKHLRVHIRSEGGNVFDGLAIYNTLLRHPARVETIIESLAASIASVIALAGRRITMEPAALFMIHNPHALAFGGAEDMRKMAELLDKVTDVLTDVYVAHTDEPRRQVRDWMSATTWFKAAEAKSAGFVDFIAELPERDPKDPEPDDPAEPHPPEPAPQPEEPAPASAWRRNLAARELALLSAQGDCTWR